MIDDHHVVTAVEQIVGHLGVFHVAFDATGADHHHPLMSRGRKRKADRHAVHAAELALFPQPPKSSSGPVAKAANCVSRVNQSSELRVNEVIESVFPVGPAENVTAGTRNHTSVL